MPDDFEKYRQSSLSSDGATPPKQFTKPPAPEYSLSAADRANMMQNAAADADIPTLTDVVPEFSGPQNAGIADAARAAAPPKPIPRLGLPMPPPDGGKAVNDAITARGNTLPAPPSDGAFRQQLGLKPAPGPAPSVLADSARAAATPVQRFPLPMPPPDGGKAVNDAITARGNTLPAPPSDGTIRMQMGLKPSPVSAVPAADYAPGGVAGRVEPTFGDAPPSPIANGARASILNNEGGAQVGSRMRPPKVPLSDGGQTLRDVIAARNNPVPPSPSDPALRAQLGLTRQGAAGAAPPAGGPQSTAGAPGGGPQSTAGAAGGAAQPATGGRFANFMEGASNKARAALPGAELAINNPLLRRGVGALRWVEPAIETSRVAKVALDQKSDGYDVATQAATGTGKIAAMAAGAGLGAEAGSLAGPVGTLLGGLVGGGLGLYVGDQGIRKLRAMVGLDESHPSERVDQRQAAARAAATAAAKPAASPIGQAATAATAAPKVPTTPTAATAPAAPAAPAVDMNALNAHYNTLQQEQLQSPIAFTTIGDSNGTAVYYKDGRMVHLNYGEQVPQEVARYNDLSSQLNALRNGQYPASFTQPGAAAAAPAPLTAGAAPAVSSPVQQQVVAEAQRQGYDPRMALAKMSLETGGSFDFNAKNPKSSAFGLGQMLASNRAAYGTEDQWKDPQFAIASTVDFMKKNDAALSQRLGHAPSLTESYLGHQLGPAGAAALLHADPNAPIDQVVAGFQSNPKVAADIVNNNGMAGLTAGQAVAKWDKLIQQHAAAFGGGGAPAAPAAEGAATVPAFRTLSPVGVIEGAHQYTEMPTEGGYVRMPNSIVQAGRLAGNVPAAMQNFLANQNEGIANAQNPTRGKLAEKQIETQGVIAGHQLAADAAVRQAEINALHQKFMKVGGDHDATTGMQTSGDWVLNTETGQEVPRPHKTFPIPSRDAIDHLKNAPQTAPEFDAIYGPGAAQQFYGH